MRGDETGEAVSAEERRDEREPSGAARRKTGLRIRRGRPRKNGNCLISRVSHDRAGMATLRDVVHTVDGDAPAARHLNEHLATSMAVEVETVEVAVRARHER